MDEMIIRVPVTIKSKLTEALKTNYWVKYKDG